jgi:hypothetical protein
VSKAYREKDLDSIIKEAKKNYLIIAATMVRHIMIRELNLVKVPIMSLIKISNILIRFRVK